MYVHASKCIPANWKYPACTCQFPLWNAIRLSGRMIDHTSGKWKGLCQDLKWADELLPEGHGSSVGTSQRAPTPKPGNCNNLDQSDDDCFSFYRIWQVKWEDVTSCCQACFAQTHLTTHERCCVKAGIRMACFPNHTFLFILYPNN